VEEFEIAFISGRSRFQTPGDMFLKSEKEKKKRGTGQESNRGSLVGG